VVFLTALPASPTPPQESETQEFGAEWREKLRQTGVFFRADAPRALRNPDDANLPVYLEIINGVERTGQSAVTALTRLVRREPIRLEGVNVFVKPVGARREFRDEPLNFSPDSPFTFDARQEEGPLEVTERFRNTLQVPRETLLEYLKRNFLGGPFREADLRVVFHTSGWPPQTFYLRVRLEAPPLPGLAGWRRGDPHYHSGFTDNAAERGYPLEVTRQAALHAGLDWVLLTDHSTDLTAETFAAQLEDVRRLRDERFVFIRGEELTVASARTDSLLTSLHLVVAPSPDDPDRGFASTPGDAASAAVMTGDGSVASPALPLGAALEHVAAAGGFAFAAHPFDPVSPILRGGSWNLNADYLDSEGRPRAPLVGLQPWNRATNLTADDLRDPFCIRRGSDPAGCFQPDAEADQYARLERGIELGWKPLLARALAATADDAPEPAFKTHLAAGTDAHGDFNFGATLDVVDFFARPRRGLTGFAEDNALGTVTTAVFCPEGMGARGECVLQALREGRSVLTNGPLAAAGFDMDSSGTLAGPEDILPGGHVTLNAREIPPLALEWASSDEFGPLTSLRLIVGTKDGESATREIPLPTGQEMASSSLRALDIRADLDRLGRGWGYLRVEMRTRNRAGEEFRCYTNPLWVRVRDR
jgi:hypothetical protein